MTILYGRINKGLLLCFTGSPCCNVSYYNYISTWPYYIVIHLTILVHDFSMLYWFLCFILFYFILFCILVHDYSMHYWFPFILFYFILFSNICFVYFSTWLYSVLLVLRVEVLATTIISLYDLTIYLFTCHNLFTISFDSISLPDFRG